MLREERNNEAREGQGDKARGRVHAEEKREIGTVERHRARCVRQQSAAILRRDVSVCVALEADRGRWPRVRAAPTTLGRARH